MNNFILKKIRNNLNFNCKFNEMKKEIQLLRSFCCFFLSGFLDRVLNF